MSLFDFSIHLVCSTICVVISIFMFVIHIKQEREVFRQSPQISGMQHIDRLDHLFYVRSIYFDGRGMFYPEKVHRSCGFLFPAVPDDIRTDRTHVFT